MFYFHIIHFSRLFTLRNLEESRNSLSLANHVEVINPCAQCPLVVNSSILFLTIATRLTLSHKSQVWKQLQLTGTRNYYSQHSGFPNGEELMCWNISLLDCCHVDFYQSVLLKSSSSLCPAIEIFNKETNVRLFLWK